MFIALAPGVNREREFSVQHEFSNYGDAEMDDYKAAHTSKTPQKPLLAQAPQRFLTDPKRASV